MNDDFMSFDSEDMMEQIKHALETGDENPFDVIALAISHLGGLQDNHDVTFEFRAVMFALGQEELGRALGRVTMRIGDRHIMVALAMRSEYRETHDDDMLRAEIKPALDRAVISVLNAHGARVDLQEDGTYKITSWEDSDRQAGQVIDGIDIEKQVSEFREELKTVDNPMSRWMPPKEDQ